MFNLEHIFIFVLIILFSFVSNQQNQSSISENQPCSNNSQILESLLRSYNKLNVPGGKVNVTVYLWVQEIISINEATSEFELDIYLCEEWRDRDLDFEWMNPCNRNLSLHTSTIDKLWTPTTTFINSKQSSIHQSPYPNIFMALNSDGKIWFTTRLRLMIPCEINHKNFPFDNVTCHLLVTSNQHNTDEVSMEWPRQGGVAQMSDKKIIRDFELKFIKNISVTQLYPTGFWDELTALFMFDRLVGWYVLHGYLPSYLLVFISWISFVFGSNLLTARAILCLFSFVSLESLYGNVIRNLPKMGFVTAMDVWMITCMFFIFGSILELGYVGYRIRKISVHKRYPTEFKMMLISDASENELLLETNHKNEIYQIAKIDQLSAIIFPTLFSIFNIFYWWYYL